MQFIERPEGPRETLIKLESIEKSAGLEIRVALLNSIGRWPRPFYFRPFGAPEMEYMGPIFS